MMFLNKGYSLSILLTLLLISSYPVQANNLIHDQSPLLKEEDPISKVISSSPLLSLHRDLCQIESISNNEQAVGDYLFSYLKRHNFNVLRQEVPQPSGSKNGKKPFNIFAWPKAASTSNSHESEIEEEEEEEDKDDDIGNFAPKVILTSHIDTVPPFIPYSASAPSSSSSGSNANFNRSDILISGRGTVDDKACVAAQIHAVLSLLSNYNTTALNPLPVALLFVTTEESTGSGMKTFSSSALHIHLSNPPNQQEAYDTLIFGEPTQSRLPRGHKGILLFSLHATGRAAHSGYPWLGRSANSMLIPVLSALDKLSKLPGAEGGLPRSDRYGNSTLNIGLVRGGVAANVVPENAEAEVAIRLAGSTPNITKSIILDAVKNVNEDVEVRFWGPGYGPVELDADVPNFNDEEGDDAAVNYGTDVPNWEIPKHLVGRVKRYLYGPGSILVAHGEGEGLRVGELERAVEGYGKLIEVQLGRD